MKYINTLSEYLKESKTIEELSLDWHVDRDIKDGLIEKVKILLKVFFNSNSRIVDFINVDYSTHLEDQIEMDSSNFSIDIGSQYDLEDEKSYGVIKINGKGFDIITHSHDTMGVFDSDFYEKELLRIKKEYEVLSNTKYTDGQISHNYIYPLIKTFIKKDNFEELISEFYHYRIIDSGVVYKDRLEMFMSDFDLDMPNLDDVKEYYKIV